MDTVNSLIDIKNFFCTGEGASTNAEFMEFWKSLDEDEKADFREQELPEQ